MEDPYATEFYRRLDVHATHTRSRDVPSFPRLAQEPKRAETLQQSLGGGVRAIFSLERSQGKAMVRRVCLERLKDVILGRGNPA
jgi:hypothetical protein